MNTTETHKHAWKMVAHIDSCHAFRSAYVCECGATADTYDERSPEGYGMVWMMDDDGAPMCDRCAELIAGAEPKHERNVPDSNQDSRDEA